jgi:hypothetical protein
MLDMITIEQNWLGHIPIYYNVNTNTVSDNINDVIDYSNLEIDPEGLINYLSYGYCVFGRTPVKGVKFLRQNQSLLINTTGEIVVADNDDSCLDYLEKVTPEYRVWDILQSSIIEVSNRFHENTILIPTSGGYDSRLLNFFCPIKHNVLACTYGISNIHERSFEIVHARELCRRLGISWNGIRLGQFHAYLDLWDKLYGISTHAHGMYQWEFYSIIREQFGVMPLLSGIVGDLWAGSSVKPVPAKPEELINLGHTHGITFPQSQCLLRCNNELLQQEFETERYKLKNERYRVLYLIRTKIILLSYLLAVPKKLGFIPYSPYIDKEVAMSMLTVEPSRWRGRKWQRDFIANNGLDVEHTRERKSFRNDLDFNAMTLSPLPLLNSRMLSSLFNSDYIKWINDNICTFTPITYLNHWISGTAGIGRLARLLGVNDRALAAYNSYLVLRPIEQLLLRSEQWKEYSVRG